MTSSSFFSSSSSSSFFFPFPFRNPLYHSDFIYNITPSGRKFNTNSEIVAQKADEIIKKRRQALMDQVSVFVNVNDQDFITVFFSLNHKIGEINNEDAFMA